MLHEAAVQALADRGYSFVPFLPGVDANQAPGHVAFYKELWQ